MSKNIQRISAIILLVILIGVPFLDWKLGAVLWMCAWLVFIFRNLYSGQTWNLGEKEEQEDEHE